MVSGASCVANRATLCNTLVITPCGGLVVGIGSYAWSGIGEVADLLATVHYISRGAVIWDPPKLVKRPVDVARALHS